MIDPMANIGGTQPISQPNQPDANNVHAEEVFDVNAQQHNLQQMESIRSFMGIVSGCCAGILGLTNLYGIVFFVWMHLVVSASLRVQMYRGSGSSGGGAGSGGGGDLEKYFKGLGTVGFWLDGLQNCFMSFMLFWTLFYGLVYLF
mmetsp:Transcript_10727/g.20050  ORF Transcript_10727/g.20050 Transcript_10727/m.20050 type:complete len:145 (-) Transcript_10727:50-484(-)